MVAPNDIEMESVKQSEKAAKHRKIENNNWGFTQGARSENVSLKQHGI